MLTVSIWSRWPATHHFVVIRRWGLEKGLWLPEPGSLLHTLVQSHSIATGQLLLAWVEEETVLRKWLLGLGEV